MEDSIHIPKANQYALEAQALVDKHEMNQYRQPIMLQVAKSYYKLKDSTTFRQIFNTLDPESIKNDKILEKEYYNFSGDINFDTGDYVKAITFFMQSTQLLESSDFASMETLTKKIEKSYAKLGDYRTAYKYANRLNVLQDSLNTEANLKAIQVFETKLRQKDAETERLKYESKILAQKKSTIYIGFFSSLILLSLLFYNRLLDEKVKMRTAALNTKNKELESSLKEMENFSYIASHDIKEPMRVVSSVTGLIQKKLTRKEGDTNEFKNEFDLVNNSIKQLYTLIEDLSEFVNFKSSDLTYQLVDSKNLALNVSDMLGNKTADFKGKINVGELPNIYSSTSLLTVIFKNLIENGLKYNDSDNPEIDISYQAKANHHVFRFKDNGIGIDKKYHKYIFQMFKRLESRSVKGSGLGLGLVSKSVEKLKGSITVKSKVGQGSEFILSLPKNYEVENPS